VRIALQVREGRAGVDEFARRLVAALAEREIEIGELGEPADMIIAVGGDGTMLAAVEQAHRADIPVLGFNLGTFGFLAAAQPDELETVADRLASGDFEIDHRMTVAATVDGTVYHGVNDVVIEKVDSQRLVELSVAVGDTHFSTYRADGLIVATPTGSTAYSFSAGGPLVSPAVDAFVLTPVAAHSLFSRSILLPPEEALSITVNRDRTVKVSVDKQSLGQLSEGDRVEIARGERPAKFVTFEAPSFPGLVKHKFDLP
jgi:NAD+ kinase